MQLTLPFGISNDASFQSFVGEENAQVSEMLQHFVDEQKETYLYVSGGEGTGKTHLAIAVINRCEEMSLKANYFSLKSLGELGNDAMLFMAESFLDCDVVVLDDLQAGLLDADQERWLFSVFNQLRDHGKSLIVFANCAVPQLGLSLKDLQSRLLSGPSFRLKLMSDEDKARVLRALAHGLGLTLNEDLSAYILKRSGRDIRELLKVLEVLDRASWVEKQKLSIPFVKKVLAW